MKNIHIVIDEGVQLDADQRKEMEKAQLHDILWRMQRKSYAKLKRLMETWQLSRDTLLMTQDFS